jgi:hypothetical protein
MTTFTTQDRIDAEITVEPIPFAGIVSLQDADEKEQMLRDQIRIQQNEIGRLKAKLMEHGINE